MKAKRINKGKGKKNDTVGASNDENDTLVLQRLSAEVSRKAQKYSGIAAKDFVSNEYRVFPTASTAGISVGQRQIVER